MMMMMMMMMTIKKKKKKNLKKIKIKIKIKKTILRDAFSPRGLIKIYLLLVSVERYYLLIAIKQ